MSTITPTTARLLRHATRAALVTALAISAGALAQAQGYPPPPSPSYAAAPAAPVSAKEMFANTLAALTQAAGTAIVGNLQQGLTVWFNEKLAGGSPAPAYQPPLGAPAPQTAAHDQDYGGYPAPPQYGPTDVPAGGSADYDATPGSALPYGVQDDAPAPAYYAGLAYEIHLLARGGGTQPVDPTSYEFRTGDRFVVFYRPTLPGEVVVSNVNPLGRESVIDTAAVAAGELARLGPYEFTATTGDERLRLVLQPCSTPALASTTRDIVRVSESEATGAAALGVGSCSSGNTRSLRGTRDIKKVSLEGTTGYALDALSAQEVASGEIDAREVTITLRHR